MKKRAMRGFTLMEMLVSMSIALLLLWAGVVVYQQAQNSSMYMTQHSVVQGNVRTALNQLTQDLNLAGYGLPIAGVTVPSAAIFSCTNSSSSSTYAYNCPASSFSFPVISGNSTLSGVTPFYQLGATVNGNKTDMLMIAYVDSASDFANDSLTCTAPATGTVTAGSSVSCGFDTFPLVSASVSSSTTTLNFDPSTAPAPNDSKWGFKVGDLVMVSNSTGEAIGEVTAVGATSVTLGSGDPMRLNQANGTTGSVPSVLGFGSGSESYNSGKGPLPQTNVFRLYIVSYYVQTDPLLQAMGTASNPTRLYRVVNGDSNQNPPVPIAEQISNMYFNYDLFNSVCGGSLTTNLPNPTTSQIGLIKTVKANIWAASTLNTVAVPGQQIQQVPLSTTVSPRNLSFFDSYSSTSTGSC